MIYRVLYLLACAVLSLLMGYAVWLFAVSVAPRDGLRLKARNWWTVAIIALSVYTFVALATGRGTLRLLQ